MLRKQNKTQTILATIYEKAAAIPAKTVKEKVFNIPDILAKVCKYSDTSSFDVLQEANLTLFSKTRTNTVRNKHNLKKYAKSDIRHIEASANKIFCLGAELFPCVDFDHLDNELKVDETNFSNKKITFLTLLRISVTGNITNLKSYIKHAGINPKALSQQEAFSLLHNSALSGEIAMISFVKEWLGNLKDHPKNNQTDVTLDVPLIDTDHTKNSILAIDQCLNLNYLILPAIASGRSTMIDYVIKNFIDKKLDLISSIFATTCLKALISTCNPKIINKISNEPTLKPLFLKANSFGKIDYYANGFNRVISSLTYFFKHASKEYIKELHNKFFKNSHLTDHSMFILYMACIDREDDFRTDVIKLFKLTAIKTSTGSFCNKFIQPPIHNLNHIRKVIQDFKINPKTWQFDNRNIAEIAAEEGALETLREALETWKCPIRFKHPNNKNSNPGLIALAVYSRNIDIFNFIIKFLEESPGFDWNKVNWKLVIEYAKSYPSFDILNTLYDYLTTQRGYKRDKFISVYFNQTYDSGNLANIKFVVEKLKQKERIYTQHSLTADGPRYDMMQFALDERRLDSIKYLIEVACYDIILYADRIIEILSKDENPGYQLEYFEAGIIKYLIEAGLPITSEQLTTLQTIYTAALKTQYHIPKDYVPNESDELSQKLKFANQQFNDWKEDIVQKESLHLRIIAPKP